MSLRTTAIVLFVLMAAAMAPAFAQGPAPVRVDEIVTEPMRQTAPVLGRIVARQRGEIAAQVAGAVQTVPVDVGDQVEPGDVLASIDDSWLKLTVGLREAALAEAEASAKREEASATMTRQALDRLERLKDTAAYSGARYDDADQEVRRATAALAAARARIASARADLLVARLAIERSKIRAPYAGVIVERHAQPGAYLNVGSPVATLIDHTTLEIEVDVPVDQSANLEPGTTMRAVRADGSEANATVRAVVPEENPLTRTRAVRLTATFDESSRHLAAGESVTVHVPVAAERTVTTVHKDAVVQQASGPTVFVVEDGAANIRPVTLGIAVGERLEVLDGLKSGETVVVRGNERLQPGQKVTF